MIDPLNADTATILLNFQSESLQRSIQWQETAGNPLTEFSETIDSALTNLPEREGDNKYSILPEIAD
jgi:hypothetical protein